MSDLITMLSAASGAGGGAETDPNFNQTTLLLHGDGTNGAQNNTFLDSSTNNFTITRNGNTTQGTFSPFSVADGEWSNYFDGTGDYLTAPDNVAYTFGTSDFTVEGWVFTGTSATQCLGGQGDSAGSSSSRSFLLYASISGNAAFSVGYSGNNNVTITSSTALPLNQWNHVAGVRDGATLRLYLNGVEVATGNISTASINDSGNPMTIGRPGDFNGEYLTGYCSNFRIVKGTCLYPSGTTFTPSTSPLTAISGTSLLTCQSNRFVDNSTNAFAITVNGNTSVQPFSPFAPSAAYDASVNGGSGYFDGTGDYLSVADDVDFDMSSGDFCVEAWIYPLSGTGSNGGILGSSLASSPPVGWTLRYLSGTSKLNISDASNNYTSTATIPLNAWTHVAATRSGTDLRLFINGALDSTNAGISASVDFSSTAFYVGRGYDVDAGNAYFKGYILSARVVKGAAVYTSAFTPPTAPLTAISGTSFLCNFTNAGIFDNTGKNNLETVGNAQIDTTTKKYGTGSMEFDGTGDWLKVLNSPDIQLGTGNFTIEFWVYLATGDTGSARGLVAKGGASTGWLVSLDSSEKVVFTYTTSTITSSGAITTNAWNHIAVVREGTGSNQTKIYIGGTNDGTGTVSTDFNQTEVMYIGANRAAGDPMKGFIDDLRITKGVARYTANFTPPSRAFPDL